MDVGESMGVAPESDGRGAAVAADRGVITEIDWHAVAFRTEPIDREAAAAAVAELYRISGAEAAPEIVWCASPAEAARLVVARRELYGASMRERLRTRPWHEGRAELLERLGREGFVRAVRETCGQLAPTVSRLLEQIAGAVAGPDGARQEHSRLLLALTFAVHGQHDAAWLPLFTRHRPSGRAGELLGASAAVAQQAHWWWPFDNTAVLCERPVALHLDERGRLHHGDGPALAYADGFALYRWHGVRIPEDFARTLASLTPHLIRMESNAELRRVMFEHYGHDRYIREAGARLVHEDGAGRLWRIELPGDEPIAMVEVVNATAEPDGTFRTYWLRVPPRTTSATAAVAWTFGLTEQEYRPQVQT